MSSGGSVPARCSFGTAATALRRSSTARRSAGARSTRTVGISKCVGDEPRVLVVLRIAVARHQHAERRSPAPPSGRAARRRRSRGRRSGRRRSRARPHCASRWRSHSTIASDDGRSCRPPNYINWGLFDDAQERVHDVGIELPSALPIDLRDRLVHRPRRLVGPLLRQGVEDVGDRHDAPRQRDVGAADAGVAAAVPALVVGERDFLGQPQQRELAARQDARADRRVRLDDLELLRRELADLEEDARRARRSCRRRAARRRAG